MAQKISQLIASLINTKKHQVFSKLIINLLKDWSKIVHWEKIIFKQMCFCLV